MNDLVSIIVPVYQIEKYIRICLDSILHQTYPNIEVILINDGSTDNTGKICDEYKLKDDRIKVIHKINEGVAIARNEGIKISKGKYLTFIDGDDYVALNYIELLVNSINASHSDMSLTDSMIINENTTVDYSLVKGNTKELNDFELLRELISMRIIHNISGKMFKREIFNQIMFTPNKKYAEDLEVIYKYVLKIKKAIYIDVRAYFYLIRSDSAMQKQFDRNQMVEISTVEESMSLVTKKYPVLSIEAQGRCIYSYFAILRWILYSKNKDKYIVERNFLKNKIISSNKNILISRKTSLFLKIKYLSYIIGGENLFYFIQKKSDMKRKIKTNYK